MRPAGPCRWPYGSHLPLLDLPDPADTQQVSIPDTICLSRTGGPCRWPYQIPSATAGPDRPCRYPAGVLTGSHLPLQTFRPMQMSILDPVWTSEWFVWSSRGRWDPVQTSEGLAGPAVADGIQYGYLGCLAGPWEADRIHYEHLGGGGARLVPEKQMGSSIGDQLTSLSVWTSGVLGWSQRNRWDPVWTFGGGGSVLTELCCKKYMHCQPESLYSLSEMSIGPS